jgi:hydroxyacylglutathione hydrolase
MRIERFVTPGLAQVAYGIADEAAGVAVIIDPRRDVEVYQDWAAARRVRITAILETHVHADFVSGARELAAATGATIHVSRIGQQEFPHEPVDDGDEIPIGTCLLRACATPGHTPEHLAYLLANPATGPEPIALFSGDALFVGEVGRPDLLGERETRVLAAQLYRTVAQLKALDDALVVYPGHTAGSACGKKISDAPATTIGREKIGNYAFKARSEEEFVGMVLAGMPTPPTYYPILKRVNKVGAPLLRDVPPGGPLTAVQVREGMAAGALVIDARPQAAFGAGHIAGAQFAGIGDNFVAWMGWLAPYDRDLVLVLADDAHCADALVHLHRIGLDRVAGYLAGGMAAWHGDVETLPQLSADDLAAHRAKGKNGLALLDVRSDGEWDGGHIAGAHHRFAGEIVRGNVAALPDGSPLAIICGSGYRSSVVASHLQMRGCANVVNVAGGMEAWERAGLPMTKAEG